MRKDPAIKRFSIISLAILALTPLTRTTAQERPPVEPGARIRVTAPSVFSDRIVGTVVSWESERLVLRLGPEKLYGTTTFPIDSIIKLEISSGKKSYFGEGALIGSLVGGIIGYLACGPIDYCDDGARPAAIFAVPGFALGAIIGRASSSTIWEDVPLRQPRVSFGPQRDGGLGLSVRF